MLRDLLSSRWFQGGFAFFVLCVGGSLLYSWHVHRTTEAQFGKRTQPVVLIENRSPSTNTAPVDFQTEGVTNTPDENSDTPISESTEAFPNETEFADMADAFLPDEIVSEEAPAEEAVVSPFGFGPYPEVPADFPEQDIWDDISTSSMSPDHELIARVEIKLWTQGIHALGATYDGEHRLIYPIIDNVVYYEEKFGANGSVTRRALTSPATDDKYGSDLREGIIAPHLTVYYFPDGGIDPYEFLDLP
ncbi:MAG: hypothetical protein OXU51_16135 [Candidatus Poribacteria bacterium]|nr:hypothetical protein [Candidatus Poribacteria bacterium]